MRFSTAMCSFSQPHAGVPPVGENVGDVRMLQLEKNTAIISSYARQARNAGFRGLFCEVSDPVDPLAKAAWPRQQSRRHRRFSTDRDCCPEQVPGLRTRRDECARCLLCAQRRSLCAVSQRRPLLRRSPARSSLSPIPSKTTTTPLSAGTHHARPRSQSAHARARLQCRSWRRVFVRRALHIGRRCAAKTIMLRFSRRQLYGCEKPAPPLPVSSTRSCRSPDALMARISRFRSVACRPLIDPIV